MINKWLQFIVFIAFSIIHCFKNTQVNLCIYSVCCEITKNKTMLFTLENKVSGVSCFLLVFLEHDGSPQFDLGQSHAPEKYQSLKNSQAEYVKTVLVGSWLVLNLVISTLYFQLTSHVGFLFKCSLWPRINEYKQLLIHRNPGSRSLMLLLKCATWASSIPNNWESYYKTGKW